MLDEIVALEQYGIEKIYSPADGRALGLEGMIRDMLERVGPVNGVGERANLERLPQLITRLEEGEDVIREELAPHTPIIGFTGTGGAGKSSLTDEVLRRLLADFPKRRFAILSIDPSKRRTGGALLGDRIGPRMPQ